MKSEAINHGLTNGWLSKQYQKFKNFKKINCKIIRFFVLLSINKHCSNISLINNMQEKQLRN